MLKIHVGIQIQKDDYDKTSTCDECVSVEGLEFIKFTAINNTSDNLKVITAFKFCLLRHCNILVSQ